MGLSAWCVYAILFVLSLLNDYVIQTLQISIKKKPLYIRAERFFVSLLILQQSVVAFSFFYYYFFLPLLHQPLMRAFT